MTYCRALAAYIRNSRDEGVGADELVHGGAPRPGAEVELTHEPETERLSKIVEVLNEHFGLELGEADQLLFDQFEETWAADHALVNQAKNNSMENFKLVFDPKFINTIVTRMDANQSIFKQVWDDQEFQDILKDFYVRKMYSRLRSTEAPPPAGRG
jgi:type I restriction enzyme, R subunit